MKDCHSKRFEEIKETHRQIAKLIPVISSYTVDCSPENLLFPDLQTLPKDILTYYISSIQTKSLRSHTEAVEWSNLCKDHPKRQAHEAHGFVGLYRGMPYYYTNLTKYAIEEFIKDTEKQIFEAEKEIEDGLLQLSRAKERILRQIEDKENLIKELSTKIFIIPEISICPDLAGCLGLMPALRPAVNDYVFNIVSSVFNQRDQPTLPSELIAPYELVPSFHQAMDTYCDLVIKRALCVQKKISKHNYDIPVLTFDRNNARCSHDYVREIFSLKNEIRTLKNSIPKDSEFINRQVKQKQAYIAEWKDKLTVVRNGMYEAFALIQAEKDRFEKERQELVDAFENAIYLYQWNDIAPLFSLLLNKSEYSFDFERKIGLEYTAERGLIINYQLPTFEDIQKIEPYFPITKLRKAYEDIIYAMTIRSMAEVFHFDERKYINSICFNGVVTVRNKCTGKLEDRIILSLNATRGQIEALDLEYISPKECFKFLKGVSAAKLHDSVPIVPIQTLSFADKRVVEAKKVETDTSVNLAEMDWEEFEHLVRQIFEWEFNTEGTEVHVTQASRDGGVDAIVFDPDPIRGGKIVIQAKRYTNTVGVSAVRDLYGTVINEGANKGILITTSDYGADSYKFAQGKPLTLLNGGHLLYLLEKHGRKARINISEAKDKIQKNNKE